MVNFSGPVIWHLWLLDFLAAGIRLMSESSVGQLKFTLGGGCLVGFVIILNLKIYLAKKRNGI